MATASESPYRLPMIGADDPQAATAVNNLWRDWQAVRRPWRQLVEQNIRLLAGRQYDEYLPEAGRFVDITDFLVSGDDRWRAQPVFNWVGKVWFPLALAKLTENIPVLGAIPATADARDATMAALFDPVYRYEWDQVGMPELIFWLYGWMLSAGRGVLRLRWDPTRGPSLRTEGPADIPLPDGTTVHLENAPYHKVGKQYVPAVRYNPERGTLDQVAPMGRLWEGDLAVDLLSPTAVMQPYGPRGQRPRWTLIERLMHVDDIRAKFGRTVEPNVSSDTPDDLLLAMEYTSAYGMPQQWESGMIPGIASQPPAVVTDGLVRVREYWGAASEAEGNGRLLMVAQQTVLDDDENPYVGPGPGLDTVPETVFIFDKPGFPWRQEGDSDIEALDPVQRAKNRRLAAGMDACDYHEQPTRMVDGNAVGDDQMDAFNERGGSVRFNGAINPQPAYYLQPPPIPPNTREMLGILNGELNAIGHVNAGGQGNAVTNDASGELQREVRFDADRPWGTTLRLHSYVWTRYGQSAMHVLGVAMPRERLLTLSGEDNAAQFLTVEPDLFRGRINVIALPESQVLETRQDKQNRIMNLVDKGLPLEIGLKALGYPDLQRLTRPGGEAYSVQVREIVEMAQTGIPAQVLPEDDDDTHILVLREHLQTLAFRRYAPPIQAALLLHLRFHQANQARKQGEDAARQLSMQAQLAHAGQAMMPTPPAEEVPPGMKAAKSA